jgi:hypothetical protein
MDYWTLPYLGRTTRSARLPAGHVQVVQPTCAPTEHDAQVAQIGLRRQRTHNGLGFITVDYGTPAQAAGLVIDSAPTAVAGNDTS